MEKKTSFGPDFDRFVPNSGRQFLSLRYHGQLSSYTISEITNDPILRKLSDGRTGGRD